MEKNKEQVQIIEIEFKKQLSTIEKIDQTDKGHFSQFTFRGDFLPTCLLKCRKLKY